MTKKKLKSLMCICHCTVMTQLTCKSHHAALGPAGSSPRPTVARNVPPHPQSDGWPESASALPRTTTLTEHWPGYYCLASRATPPTATSPSPALTSYQVSGGYYINLYSPSQTPETLPPL